MEDKTKKLQELQLLEQNIQNLLMQKQAFELEQAETEAALSEIENSGDEIFKIVGQLMIKTEKQKVKSELEAKKKFLDARIKNFEKQEELFSKKIDDIREDVLESDKK